MSFPLTLRARIVGWIRLAAVAVSIAGLVAAAAQAQPAAIARAYHVPRTAFGAPDLQGMWTNVSMTALERRPDTPLTFATPAEEAAFKARMIEAWTQAENAGLGMGVSEWHPEYDMARIDGRLRTSWIVSPADGRLPWRSEARARHEALLAASRSDSADGPEARTPADRCLVGGFGSSGPPMINPAVAGGTQIIQTAREVAILSEMNHDVRIVRIGGRHPPPSVHAWMGDSIGWWEGETLVVETTNFHPQEGFVLSFLRSPAARVVERFTRVGPGELRYAFEVDDPATYTEIWRAEMPFLVDKGPIYEFACHEGNYGMTNILGGARKADADAAAGR